MTRAMIASEPERGVAENWPELVKQPAGGDHLVQLYRDESFLCEVVGEYTATGLRRGEAVIIIATPAHRGAFLQELERRGMPAEDALQRGQLVLLDAEETLARFSAGGTPDWQSFHALVGGLIAKTRLDYATVRAYGEMVDLLWQRGERDAAIRLEGFWNELAELQTFSLLCAYRMDHLDGAAYHGPLDCVCRVHTHLIPARDYERFNRAVVEASREVLDAPLADMLLSISERHPPETEMPRGQATLLWLQRNMPRTAERILAEVRSRCS
jgi:hypothetical protein